MKRILTSIFALALISAAPALAADQDHHSHSQGHGGNQGDHGGNSGGGHGDGDHHDNGDHHGNYGDHGSFGHGTSVHINIWAPNTHRPPNWNVRPRHFDFHVYHRNFYSPHRYRWNPYRRPHGWYAHRWIYGERVPRFFWVRDYWITDWWMFNLSVPPYGYEWVRYGDDALLIDTRTGEVLQVVYDLFD